MASGMRKILLLRYGWGLLGLCRTRAGKEEDDEEDAEEEWHLSLEWLWCIVGLGVGEWGNHDRPCMCLPKPANLLKPRLFRSTRRPPYKKPLMPFGSFSSNVTAMGFYILYHYFWVLAYLVSIFFAQSNPHMLD